MNIKKLLSYLIPYRAVKLETARSREAIIRTLNRITGGIFSNDCEFHGKVTENSFRLMPNINYNSSFLRRNSFLPILFGSIEERGEGCVITIRMRMPLIFCIFWGLWDIFDLFGMLVGLLGILVGSVADGLLILFLCTSMLIGSLLLVGLSFSIPADRAIKRLKLLLFAEPIDSNIPRDENE